MVRKYVKKKPRPTYTKEDIEEAVEIYKRSNGGISVRSLAKEKGIPRITLFDWIGGKWCGTEKRPTKKGRGDHFRPGRPTELTLKSEEYLVSALEYLGDTGKCETDS